MYSFTPYDMIENPFSLEDPSRETKRHPMKAGVRFLMESEAKTYGMVSVLPSA